MMHFRFLHRDIASGLWREQRLLNQVPGAPNEGIRETFDKEMTALAKEVHTQLKALEMKVGTPQKNALVSAKEICGNMQKLTDEIINPFKKNLKDTGEFSEEQLKKITSVKNVINLAYSLGWIDPPAATRPEAKEAQRPALSRIESFYLNKGFLTADGVSLSPSEAEQIIKSVKRGESFSIEEVRTFREKVWGWVGDRALLLKNAYKTSAWCEPGMINTRKEFVEMLNLLGATDEHAYFLGILDIKARSEAGSIIRKLHNPCAPEEIRPALDLILIRSGRAPAKRASSPSSGYEIYPGVIRIGPSSPDGRALNVNPSVERGKRMEQLERMKSYAPNGERFRQLDQELEDLRKADRQARESVRTTGAGRNRGAEEKAPTLDQVFRTPERRQIFAEIQRLTALRTPDTVSQVRALYARLTSDMSPAEIRAVNPYLDAALGIRNGSNPLLAPDQQIGTQGSPAAAPRQPSNEVIAQSRLNADQERIATGLLRQCLDVVSLLTPEERQLLFDENEPRFATFRAALKMATETQSAAKPGEVIARRNFFLAEWNNNVKPFITEKRFAKAKKDYMDNYTENNDFRLKDDEVSGAVKSSNFEVVATQLFVREEELKKLQELHNIAPGLLIEERMLADRARKVEAQVRDLRQAKAQIESVVGIDKIQPTVGQDEVAIRLPKKSMLEVKVGATALRISLIDTALAGDKVIRSPLYADAVIRTIESALPPALKNSFVFREDKNKVICKFLDPVPLEIDGQKIDPQFSIENTLLTQNVERQGTTLIINAKDPKDTKKSIPIAQYDIETDTLRPYPAPSPADTESRNYPKFKNSVELKAFLEGENGTAEMRKLQELRQKFDAVVNLGELETMTQELKGRGITVYRFDKQKSEWLFKHNDEQKMQYFVRVDASAEVPVKVYESGKSFKDDPILLKASTMNEAVRWIEKEYEKPAAPKPPVTPVAPKNVPEKKESEELSIETPKPALGQTVKVTLPNKDIAWSVDAASKTLGSEAGIDFLIEQFGKSIEIKVDPTNARVISITAKDPIVFSIGGKQIDVQIPEKVGGMDVRALPTSYGYKPLILSNNNIDLAMLSKVGDTMTLRTMPLGSVKFSKVDTIPNIATLFNELEKDDKSAIKGLLLTNALRCQVLTTPDQIQPLNKVLTAKKIPIKMLPDKSTPWIIGDLQKQPTVIVHINTQQENPVIVEYGKDIPQKIKQFKDLPSLAKEVLALYYEGGHPEPPQEKKAPAPAPQETFTQDDLEKIGDHHLKIDGEYIVFADNATGPFYGPLVVNNEKKDARMAKLKAIVGTEDPYVKIKFKGKEIEGIEAWTAKTGTQITPEQLRKLPKVAAIFDDINMKKREISEGSLNNIKNSIGEAIAADVDALIEGNKKTPAQTPTPAPAPVPQESPKPELAEAIKGTGFTIEGELLRYDNLKQLFIDALKSKGENAQKEKRIQYMKERVKEDLILKIKNNDKKIGYVYFYDKNNENSPIVLSDKDYGLAETLKVFQNYQDQEITADNLHKFLDGMKNSFVEDVDAAINLQDREELKKAFKEKCAEENVVFQTVLCQQEDLVIAKKTFDTFLEIASSLSVEQKNKFKGKILVIAKQSDGPKVIGQDIYITEQSKVWMEKFIKETFLGEKK